MGITPEEDKRSLDVIEDFDKIIAALSKAVKHIKTSANPLSEDEKNELEKLLNDYKTARDLEKRR